MAQTLINILKATNSMPVYLKFVISELVEIATASNSSFAMKVALYRLADTILQKCVQS